MTVTIHVDDDTHAALTRLKGDDESFDDVLARLLEHPELRRELVRAGAGFWEDSDAARKAREARQAMQNEVGRRRGDARRQ